MRELPTIRTRNDIDENFANPFAGNIDDSKMKQSIDAGIVVH